MQTDMHYFGTYAMARAAGVKEDIARTIATAAEYVDDSDYVRVTLTDGKEIRVEPTAHHPSDVKQNVSPNDQRRTWVPFHFIPGNEGTTAVEKLICRTDSEIAREMVKYNLSLAREDYGCLLAGITAHVYADTFSHYGFSGISSDLNLVDNETIDLKVKSKSVLDYIVRKATNFAEKYTSGDFADLVRLGHGSVATYPDRPFLRWSFTYATTGRVSGIRNNQETFLLACKKLHEMFTRFVDQFPEAYSSRESRREFDDISAAISTVIAVEAKQDGRIEAWQKAVIDGEIFNNTERQLIPPYDPSTFVNHLNALHTYDTAQAERTLVYLFLKAADIHRDYILKELLPRYGIALT